MTQFCQLSSSFPPPLLSSFSILRNGLYFIVKKIKCTIIETFFEIPAEHNDTRWFCYLENKCVFTNFFKLYQFICILTKKPHDMKRNMNSKRNN